MPLKCKFPIRYRVRTLPDGTKQRLAFCGNKVIETKTLTTKNRKLKNWGRQRRRRKRGVMY